jgi:coenzyme F420-reducing hydrogenase gamma subunit
LPAAESIRLRSICGFAVFIIQYIDVYRKTQLAADRAISDALYATSDEPDREFLDARRVDLFIPGCPPQALAFINAVLDFAGRT